MFFWGFWIIEVLILKPITIRIKKLFLSLTVTKIWIFSLLTTIVFAVFGMYTFPTHSRFPAQTIHDIKTQQNKELSNVLLTGSNIHPVPTFYSEDKKQIENRFNNFLDTMLRKDYFSDEFNPNEKYFGAYNKEDLDSIDKITVDTIIYDHSFLKYFVSIIYCTKSRQFYGQGFIGYRKAADSDLQLFPFQHTNSTLPTNKIEECISDLRLTYFSKIRKVSQYLSFGDMVTYKYSPLDTEFWSGVFYTKGPDIDSLYYFETERNFEKRNRTKIVPSLIVTKNVN